MCTVFNLKYTELYETEIIRILRIFAEEKEVRRVLQFYEMIGGRVASRCMPTCMCANTKSLALPLF